MEETEEDHNFLFSNWGSWKFSKEGEKLLEEFLQLSIEACQIKEASREWKYVLSQLPAKSKPQDKDSEDDFQDEPRTSDEDSDGGWDEIKAFTSKIEKKKQMRDICVDIDKTVDMISALVMGIGEEKASPEMEVDSSTVILSMSQNTFTENGGQNLIGESSIIESNERKDTLQLGGADGIDLPHLLLAKLNAETIDEMGVNEMIAMRTITKEQLTNVWTKLETSTAKLALSRSLASVGLYNSFLCQALLLPWLNESNFESEIEIVDNVSEILPLIEEVAVKELLLPLISNPSAIFVKKLDLLTDIICKVDHKQWASLLRQFINTTNVSLEKWQLPVIMKLIAPLTEDSIDAACTSRLINLLNSSVDDFVNDKHFGNLLIAVAQLIHRSHKLAESISILKETAEKYNGIMRFKVMSIIKSSPYL